MRTVRIVVTILAALLFVCAAGTYWYHRSVSAGGLVLLAPVGLVNPARLADGAPIVVRVKNASANAIRVSKITTSCGCTTAKASFSEIKPREDGHIDILINKSVKGKLNLQVVVEYISNDDVLKLMIPLEGWNLPDGYIYTANLDRLVYGAGLRGKTLSKSIEVYGLFSTLENLTATSKIDGVTSKLGPIELADERDKSIGRRKVETKVLVEGDSTPNDVLCLSSGSFDLMIPLFWQLDKAERIASTTVFLGRIVGGDPVQASVSVKGGPYEIVESDRAASEITRQTTVDSLTKLQVQISPPVSSEGMLEGTVLLKSKVDGSLFAVNWSGFANSQ